MLKINGVTVAKLTSCREKIFQRQGSWSAEINLWAGYPKGIDKRTDSTILEHLAEEYPESLPGGKQHVGEG